MKIIKTIYEMKKELNKIDSNKKIGFVPTMGYLHKGHISLLNIAKKENDILILSIYVNPIQFGKNEDYDRYPSDFDRDSKYAKEAGVDIIFLPDNKEIYPDNYNTYVNVEYSTDKLCGKSRPGHFRGVTTIVNKLINITKANNIYFGQKDYQQYVIVKKMIIDLNMNLKIRLCPIIREKDGIAMSSRNVYLSKQERKDALVLYKALEKARFLIQNGERDKIKIIEYMKKIIEKVNCSIDYIEILNEDLNSLNIIEGRILIAVAVFFGKTRLIDNIIMEIFKENKR